MIDLLRTKHSYCMMPALPAGTLSLAVL